jgi:hypothetical protein
VGGGATAGSEDDASRETTVTALPGSARRDSVVTTRVVQPALTPVRAQRQNARSNAISIALFMLAPMIRACLFGTLLSQMHQSTVRP